MQSSSLLAIALLFTISIIGEFLLEGVFASVVGVEALAPHLILSFFAKRLLIRKYRNSTVP